MGKKLSPETLESFFNLDRIMNREGLDGPDLDEWFQLCATVSSSLSGPSNAGANERTALRVPMSFPAKIKIGDETFDGKTRNVSVQGISLSSQSKLPINNRTVHVSVVFSFPRFLRRAEKTSMSFSGHVRWSKIGETSIMNLEFVPLPHDDFEALEAILHRYIKMQIA